MRQIILDVETTTKALNEKYTDYSPYNTDNKLVSIGWCMLVDGVVQSVRYVFLFHKDLVEWEKTHDKNSLLQEFRNDLASSDQIIAFNAKFDVSWLEESGFNCDNKTIHDCMISEYVMARGRSDISFKLADCCKRYKLDNKGEIWDKYPDTQISDMPIDEVEDYGRQDILCTSELYFAQKERLSKESYLPLHKTIGMMNEFCRVLINMERAGILIDDEALSKVRDEFTDEAEKLKFDLNELVKKYMGDTKVNLDSPQQLSEVIYSRKIRDGFEDEWVKTFNIGRDERNKLLRRPKMSFREYAGHVQRMCKTIMRTEVMQCPNCNGSGSILKIRKDGTPFKKPNKCKKCEGTGALYKDTTEIAGFKMRPNNISFTTVGGFSTSHTYLAELLDQAKQQKKEDAVVFLEKLMRLSSLSSYLSNFVGGISIFKQKNNILHTNFNQCITATGRLSSTKPNLQNMPRETTFPIRKVFVSRFENGRMIDSDFGQLEFRAAIHLAKDERGRADILSGLDVHKQSQKIITDAGETITRQEAKKHCVPTNSLIYTKRGFKRYDELVIGEPVLTYNKITKQHEYQPLLAVNVYDDAQIYAISNYAMNLYATEDHNWIGQKKIDHRWFTNGRGHNCLDYTYEEREFTTSQISFAYKIRTTVDMNPLADFWQHLTIMKQTSTTTIVQVKKDLDIDEVRMAIHRGGYFSRTMPERRRLMIYHKCYLPFSRFKKTKLGKTKVWCPTTPNGTWVMKQGDIITITGNSFKPLYGGMSGTEAQKAYYKAFLDELYTGVKAWHTSLQEEAIARKMVTLPTGRQYIFPDVERAWHGGATQRTQICNFPVQGFATADIVPIAIIRLNSEMRKLNLKSVLVLTVHDSILIDTHPDEIDAVLGLVKQLSAYATEELKLRYDEEMYVPLVNETKVGKNAMEMEKIK